ncbi:MAG: YraN family protein [Bacteroidetes bacterium]|nr:MAG: YraN family protein [Bacteroidota bacterium]
MAQHNQLGKEGELLARQMLEGKGYKILETNWRHDKDEIDIIAMDGDELVIVEVKTRSSDYFGNPEDAVNFRKEAFLIRSTEAYLEEKNLDCDSRFDIVSIILKDGKPDFYHIKDAFYPE